MRLPGLLSLFLSKYKHWILFLGSLSFLVLGSNDVKAVDPVSLSRHYQMLLFFIWLGGKCKLFGLSKTTREREKKKAKKGPSLITPRRAKKNVGFTLLLGVPTKR